MISDGYLKIVLDDDVGNEIELSLNRNTQFLSKLSSGIESCFLPIYDQKNFSSKFWKIGMGVFGKS